jgi:uncharacterized membrane protein
MSNPYESPQFVGQATEVEPVDREKLRRVARRQQWVLYALLAQIAVYVAMLALQGASGVAALLGLLFLGLAIFSMVAVFLLAKELLHIVVAVICTVLMLIPCISLLTLVIVNGRATRLLQQHGVKVGLMGANPDLI